MGIAVDHAGHRSDALQPNWLPHQQQLRVTRGTAANAAVAGVFGSIISMSPGWAASIRTLDAAVGTT